VHGGIILAEHSLDVLLARMAAHEPPRPIIQMAAKDL